MSDKLVKLIPKTDRDEFAKQMAELVQAAKLQKAYYDALIAEGFSVSETLQLIRMW